MSVDIYKKETGKGGTTRLVYSAAPRGNWNVGGTVDGQAYALTPTERFAEWSRFRPSGVLFNPGTMTNRERTALGWGSAAEEEGYRLGDESDLGYGGIADLINSLTGGGGGASASDKLASKKYADERADRAAKQRALQAYLSSGGLAGISAPERSAVEQQAERALANIAAGYEAAQGLTDTGYGALQQYLEANRVNPYTGMTVDAGLATNPMEQFLQAYGAMSPEVQAQVAAEQAARESGAGAFRNLVDVLSGAAGQAQTSREMEAQMARNLATQMLGQQRAGLISQAEMARQQALAAISQRENERKYALQQALMELGINPAALGAPAAAPAAAPVSRDPREEELAYMLGMA